MKKTRYAVLLIFIAVCLLGSIPAGAQMSLMVSPIRVELQLKPGTNETNVIQVVNTGNEPTRVTVRLEDWTMNRKGDLSFTTAGDSPGACCGWLQLNPTDFRLDPGQSRQVRYSISVPAEAPDAGYRAAIVLEGIPRQDETQAKRSVSLRGRIAVMLYATVGSPDIRAQFQDFQITARNKEVSFKLTLANEGDVHFRIKKSWIAITNSKGEEVSRVEVPDIPVLPGATRELEFKKENLDLPKGTYQAEAVLDVGKEDFLGRKTSFSVGR
jgi:P pilus assembly chaperone PapD